MTDDDKPQPKKAKKPAYQAPVYDQPCMAITGTSNWDNTCLKCGATARQKCKKP